MKFRELLREYDWPISPEGHHHNTQGWLQFDCPFCGKGTKSYHMGFNHRGAYCNCWRCGPHSLYDVVREISDLPHFNLGEILGKIDKEKIKIEEKQGKLKLPPKRVPLLEIHKSYLRKRGLDPDKMVKLWKLEGFGLCANNFSWRLFIPIYFQGEIVSWTTRSVNTIHNEWKTFDNRAIKSGNSRYRTAPAEHEKISHKKILFGEDYARHSIIVCEGPFDVFKLGPGAVATCGIAFTQAQVERISLYPRRTICFDREVEAQKRARSLCESLSVFPGETNNLELSLKDPGDLRQPDVETIRGRFLD